MAFGQVLELMRIRAIREIRGFLDRWHLHPAPLSHASQCSLWCCRNGYGALRDTSSPSNRESKWHWARAVPLAWDYRTDQQPPMPSLRDSGGFIGRTVQTLTRLANECHGSAVQEVGATDLAPVAAHKITNRRCEHLDASVRCDGKSRIRPMHCIGLIPRI
jgi:hypothetical protein